MDCCRPSARCSAPVTSLESANKACTPVHAKLYLAEGQQQCMLAPKRSQVMSTGALERRCQGRLGRT